MCDVSTYQMSYDLRRLFSTIMLYCNPVNPKELWKIFEDSIYEDSKKKILI